ncbi:hypothetical protein LEP1GSC008_0314 [Leptospira kirschneri serovar Bulgarica str. Nikolaevo]|uniref:Uncharacterized protein n=1 Tax=Leptospira kirschneri serovar Bulgarica str. Nikolaevo TaxID=1240687 RepID=M6FBT7_9LEPT|nr:hypothetical protein LEP1GSC008_0314 [Leptospira kirschneri serovar Bulgarica str. Nikolaevo]
MFDVKNLKREFLTQIARFKNDLKSKISQFYVGFRFIKPNFSVKNEMWELPHIRV